MTTVERAAPVVPPAAVTPRDRWLLGPALIALAAALVRVPFLAVPLSPDEGGYLLVASQWSPGASLYGAYWVDRPPLLIGIFQLADVLGGTVALRLLGVVAVVASILLAGALGWLGSSGRWSATVPALVCAVFLSTPLFDASEIDGELLAVPFVLGGILLLVRSLRGTSPAAVYGEACAAGGLAAAAALVKQNMVDVVVVAAVLLAGLALRRRWWDAVTRGVAFAGGGLLAVVAALVWARAHGTEPAGLWDALVTFRIQAAALIGASTDPATPERLSGLLLALAASGAPLVAGAAILGSRRPSGEPDLRWAGLAAIGWEALGAALGGSYWLHYLLALTPGLVLLVVAARGGPAPTRLRTALRWTIGYAVVSAGACLCWATLHVPGPGADQVVAAYIRSHAGPGDSMVVGFGHPDIVRDAGLPSPYPHLWSLSARVRDPRLTLLTDELEGPDAPRWVVVSGSSLATWGIDATTAQQVLTERYAEVMSDGDWHVFERR